MAKTVRDEKLGSKEARSKLAPRSKPYFRSIDRGLHIGYRKGKRGGTWLVRRYLGGEQYVTETLRKADDIQDADGLTILTFWRATAATEEQRRADAGPDVTVRSAVDEYIAAYAKRVVSQGGTEAAAKGPEYRMKRYLFPDESLPSRSLMDLRAEDLEVWRSSLEGEVSHNTITRISTDVKAALNSAAVRYRARLPAAFALEVKTGLRATAAPTPVARQTQILPDADVRATVAAAAEVDEDGGWGGDLYRMAILLGATGARFSQIARITVGDVQPGQGRVMIPVSRKGRGQKAVAHVAVRVGADVLALLKPAMAGRKGHETLLLRPRWKQVGVGDWKLIGRSAWLSPSELTRPWKAIRAKAGLSADVVPYTFRHSSIVRGLREGLPIRLVAALHDTSSAMIEKHYSAYIVDAMDELAARAVVPMVSQQPAAIRSIA